MVVYSDDQYSVDGRKGLGVIITDVESGARRMCGAEVPLDLLQWMVAALSNALHLRLAGLSARPYFRHVPGKANPADIPRRIPIVRSGSGLAIERSRFLKGDARVIDGTGAVPDHASSYGESTE